MSWDTPSPAPSDYRLRWAQAESDYPSWKDDNETDRGNEYPAGDATSLTLSGLEQGSVYKVQVRARYNDGDAPWSGSWASSSLRVSGDAQEEEATPTPEPTATPDPTPVPGAIDGLTLSSDSPGTLTVSWDAPSPHPTDYRLRWAQAESDYLPWSEDDETDRGNAYPGGGDTSLTLSGLTQGVEFKVQVRARYNDGAHEDKPWSGPWTEEVRGRPSEESAGSGVKGATDDPSAPAAPNLIGTALTPEGHVTLLWLDPSDDTITGYQVLRGPDADSLVVIEEDTGSSGTSYTDTSPPPGRTHTYAVKARNAAGLSPPSDTLTATVPAAEDSEEELTTAQQSSGATLISSIDASGSGPTLPLQAGEQVRQPFSTGPNSAGYRLSAIAIRTRGSGVDGENGSPTLAVTTQSGDTTLFTLTTPADFSTISWPYIFREFTFTAPEDATLEPNTPYMLLMSNSDHRHVVDSSPANRGESDYGWEFGTLDGYSGGTWHPQQFTVKMSIHGEVIPPVLVSNLGQTSATITNVFAGRKLAQSFVAGPGLAGYVYRFQGIRVPAATEIAFGETTAQAPQVRASLHRDAGGRPGPLLHTLTVPGDFASTVALAEYTLSALPGTVLRGGDKYWVVFEVLTSILLLSITSSTDEDRAPPPVDGWLIGDDRFASITTNVWTMLARVVKLAVLGEPEWDTSEPAGEDFPAAYFNGRETTGVVTTGTVSTGHLTAGVDTDQDFTADHWADYWYLHTGPGHSYRVEVTFGDNPGISTGGSAGISFVDPDEVDYVSGCCESDHNREDGATILHFSHTHQDREWNTRYMVRVAVFDLYNTDTAVYNGPYEITLTDITGVEQMVHTFSGGTTEGSSSQVASTDGNSVDLTTSFTTGYHTAGYTLDRIKVVFYDIASQGATPEISIHEHTSSGPGAKLCDIAVPDRVAESAVAWSWTPPHTFLAPDCADDTLAPSTNYWIVFSDMDHVEYEVEYADDPDEADYYGSGWRIQSFGKRGTSNTWVRTLGTALRIGLWAKELAQGGPLPRGEREVGATLTADTSGITDTMFEYQWQRVDGGAPADITGATSDTYTLTVDDVGKRIQLRVRFTDDGGTQETLTGPATSLVVPEPRILVGNLSQITHTAVHSEQSSGFVTGTHPLGYAIDSIEMARSPAASNPSSFGEFRLYASTSSRNPGDRRPDRASRLMTVSGPDGVSGDVLTFGAPSRVKLDPGATYHAVLTRSQGGAMGCRNAGSGLDSGSLAGFSIIGQTWIYPHSNAVGAFRCALRIRGFELMSSSFVEKVEFTSSPTQAGMYATGEVIEATVTLNEAVTFEGPPPVLLLQIGDHQRVMEYAASASSATGWVFRYTVTADDRDDDGVPLERNALRGYADADLSHRGIDNDRERHVNAVPRVVSRQVSSRPVAPNWYGPGEHIEFTVGFSLPVTVVGDPELEFNVTTPSDVQRATYVRGSGTTELVFSYTVGAADDDSDGIWWGADSLRLDGDDSITGVYNGLDAALDHSALGTRSSHRIDQNPRAVSQKVTSDPTRGANSDTYGAGDAITFEVVFNQTVTVAGGPRLRFNIGSGAGSEYASYVSGSGTDTLVFSYTVLAADADTDGIYLFDDPLDYPDTATDSIVGEDNSLPAVNEISGANRTVSGHKVDGSITN